MTSSLMTSVLIVLRVYIGGFLKLGVLFGGTYNKGYSILGSKLGPPM